jgi:flagellar motility protein MotE (MotC chaperone)
MIHILFGTWRRRAFTAVTCLLAFFVSLVFALAVAVRKAPEMADAVRKVPGLGRMAVALVEARHGPIDKPAAAPVDVPTVREMRPLSTEEIARLIQDLKDQRQFYLDKQQELAREQKRLELARQEIASERELLVALREKVAQQWEEIGKTRSAMERQVIEIQGLEARNLKQLVTSYEAMKPERAAMIIKKLDEGTAAKALYLMKERAAAKIIEQLDETVAAKLTERMTLMKQAD